MMRKLDIEFKENKFYVYINVKKTLNFFFCISKNPMLGDQCFLDFI